MGKMAGARPQPGPVIDLFAGAGGWEEGLRGLGLTALGIDNDRWACATARAAGHRRVEADIAALDPTGFAPAWGLVASPPCQAYSVAGKGLGRKDKPLVIACAHEIAAGNDSRAERLAQCRDPRSLLTVEPLRWALALRPRWVALEQVPPALGLWSLFCGLLASHGYHAAAGVLSAEQFGVPQTRKRAFLVASLDGRVGLPEPTHHSYDPRRPDHVPGEGHGLAPWASMAGALGWPPGATAYTNNQTHSGRRPRGLARPASCPAWTLDGASGSWTVEPPGGGAQCG
jgi:DNA (cytosine-5)-methyltransferase 1